MPASDFPKFVIPLLCLPRECGFAGMQKRVRDTAHCGYHNDRLGIAHRLNDACRLIDLWNRAYRRTSKFDDDHAGSLTDYLFQVRDTPLTVNLNTFRHLCSLI